jgi:hypothetical protein
MLTLKRPQYFTMENLRILSSRTNMAENQLNLHGLSLIPRRNISRREKYMGL